MEKTIITVAEAAKEILTVKTVGEIGNDPDFKAARCLYSMIEDACVTAELEDFNSVRSGLWAAYEAIIKPQGRSMEKAWSEVLHEASGRPWGEPMAIPAAEKAAARKIIKRVRKALLGNYRPEGPNIKDTGYGVHYTVAYKGGRWVVAY